MSDSTLRKWVGIIFTIYSLSLQLILAEEYKLKFFSKWNLASHKCVCGIFFKTVELSSTAKPYIMVFNQMHKFSGLGHIVINAVYYRVAKIEKKFKNAIYYFVCCLWKIIAFSVWHISTHFSLLHEVFGRSWHLDDGVSWKNKWNLNKEMSSKSAT